MLIEGKVTNKYDTQGRCTGVRWDGNAKLFFLDGSRYEGEVKDSKAEGLGVWTLPLGSTLTGTFVGGGPHGSLIYKSSHRAAQPELCYYENGKWIRN